MSKIKEISVFVDESGSFATAEADPDSPYYLLCLVFHDAEDSLDAEESNLNAALSGMGLSDGFAIHAGPLIRREDDCANFDREKRIGIFRRMIIFLQKARIKYRCFKIDKRYDSRIEAIHDTILQGLVNFLVAHRDDFNSYDKIRVYYDDGQSQITKLLKEAFLIYSSRTEFVSNVVPSRYRLFQVADVACTIELVNAKLESGHRMTLSEDRFFGGTKNFRKNYLKPLLRKLYE